jgi:L-amino acid N-acyltransferase YncA
MPKNSGEDMAIRAATLSDAAAIAAIYNHYVTETVVTFEEEPVPAAEIARRIGEVQSASLPWLVADAGPDASDAADIAGIADIADIAGYACATRWKVRSGYRFSAEITVYLAPGRAGQGIGSKLYGQLFPLLQARRIHAVIGGIALPNEASVALHEKFGMRKVAHFEQVGFKLDRWIDVGYWQRIL